MAPPAVEAARTWLFPPTARYLFPPTAGGRPGGLPRGYATRNNRTALSEHRHRPRAGGHVRPKTAGRGALSPPPPHTVMPTAQDSLPIRGNGARTQFCGSDLPIVNRLRYTAAILT
ncbi:hypothetical protein FRAHR75_190055 [Frankia sp. Hr75.2]|nr:hypothetical protein FRAHR75_190055 [Frankia sp. Hr75.2]